MAVPNFYNDEFISRTLAAGFTDIQDWLDFIVDALTVQLPVGQRWTDLGGGFYESPPDPNTGYTMRLYLARNSATQMFFTIFDQSNLTVQAGGCTISGAGDHEAFISCGPKHIVTWCDTDFGIGVMVDPAPEAPNAPSFQVFAKIRKNAAFANIGFFNLPERCVSLAPNGGMFAGPWYIANSGGTALQLATAGGSIMFFPNVGMIFPNAVNANGRFTGYCYQMAWIDTGLCSGRVAIPIDVGVVGYFIAIGGLLTMGQGFAGQGSWTLAVRVQ